MAKHQIRKGLDLPIGGAPSGDAAESVRVQRVAALGADYPGLRPRLAVEVGQRVRKGDLLFEDARNRFLRVTAPAGGTVRAIHRGERRRLESVVIGVDPELDTSLDFPVSGRGGEALREALVHSGLWTGFRTRPFNRVPQAGDEPSAIFVTAIDTEPLAAPVSATLAGREDDLARGVAALADLTKGPVIVCTAAGETLGVAPGDRVRVEEFEGPHPAGLAGTHINRLFPVGRNRQAWSMHAWDVAAIGHLLRTSQIPTERVIALTGPGMRRPRLVRTRVGASTDELVEGELAAGTLRVLSGSVLSGRAALGEVGGYLGRGHRQVCALPEGGEKEQPAWLTLGRNFYTATGAYVSAFLGAGRIRFHTGAHGAQRAMIPLETFDAVMPLDILPVPLLRAISARDTVRAEDLGCLELDEEDLALCSLVDPGKTNWGEELRDLLSLIEKEG